MARTLSATLLAAQQGTQRKPYIKVVINSVDYSDRLLSLEHHEEPYRGYATIVLDNKDRVLDAVSTLTTNLLGYRFRIGYGYYTGTNVAEPNGDNAGNEYSYSADLWVKSQQLVSSPNQLVCQLYCEDQWMYLREQRVLAAGDPPSSVGTVTATDTPYFDATFEGTRTIYELMEMIIEGSFAWTLNAAPSPDDGVLTVFKPHFSLEELPYAATVLYDLISMTACYLRPKANLIWEVVVPDAADAVNRTFYSNQVPYFHEYTEHLKLAIPNKIVVFANNPQELVPWPASTIVGQTADYTGNYVTVIGPVEEPFITTQQDANLRASAILKRAAAEKLAGYLIAEHDCGLELYDRVEVQDQRGH